MRQIYYITKGTVKSVNTFYCASSYAKMNYFGFMNTTARLTIQMIPSLSTILNITTQTILMDTILSD